MDESTDRRRRSGIEFEQLREKLGAVEYPVATGDLLDTLGDHELRIADGRRTVRETLNPLVRNPVDESDETTATLYFDSPGDVMSALLGVVDDGAIGRKGYSDRTPPVPGERTQEPDESI